MVSSSYYVKKSRCSYNGRLCDPITYCHDTGRNQQNFCHRHRKRPADFNLSRNMLLENRQHRRRLGSERCFEHRFPSSNRRQDRYGKTLHLPRNLFGIILNSFSATISYCKYNMGDTKDAYEQCASSAFPNAGQPSMYTLNDVDSLAEYSAGRYAKTVEEYQQYLEYYKTYFTQQITEGNTITLHQDNQMDAANAAAAVAQSAIQQMQASKSFYETNHMNVPNGTDNKRYRKYLIKFYIHFQFIVFTFQGKSKLQLVYSSIFRSPWQQFLNVPLQIPEYFCWQKVK